MKCGQCGKETKDLEFHELCARYQRDALKSPKFMVWKKCSLCKECYENFKIIEEKTLFDL